MASPFRAGPVEPGDRVVVRRRAGSHLTDVIGHVVTLDPLVVRPQKVGGLPSEAEAIRIDDPLIVRRMSPRRVRNSDIRAVETAYARAFPGQFRTLIDDWLTRAGSDIAERSNSATPIGHSGGFRAVPLEQIVEFYRERGLPPQLLIPERIGAPALKAIAAYDGPGRWELGPEILVMTRSLEEPLELPASPDYHFRIDPTPEEDWLAMYHFRGQPLPPEALRELAGEIEGELGFGRLVAGEDGSTIAVTRGTLTESDDGRLWLGYSAVEVAPDFRRRGLGTQLGAEMLAWGRDKGATEAYLQVLASNDAGVGLYTKLGFIEHHRHRYARLIMNQ